MSVKHQKQKWTFESCLKEARKYSSRMLWKKGSRGSYNSACNNGWLEQCASHMIRPRKAPSKNWTNWTLEECIDEAKKYRMKWLWQKGSSSSYRAADKNGWMDQCAAHMEETSRVKEWTYEMCLEEAMKAGTAGEWQELSPSSRVQAFKKGWYQKIMVIVQDSLRAEPGEHLPHERWTDEKALCEALKYKTRTEWCTSSPGSYEYARQNRIFMKCTAHMKHQKKWNYKACETEAKKHRRLVDLQKAAPGCYSVAYSKGWLPRITRHMFRPSRKTALSGCRTKG